MSIKIFRKNNFVVIDAADLPVKYLASNKADFDHVQDGQFVVWNVDNVSEDYTFSSAELQGEDGVAIGDTAAVLEYLTTNINFKTDAGSSASLISDVKNNIQGYIGLLSAVYFDGDATSSEIVIDEVDVWQDVIMTIHPQGTSDERIVAMKAAQAQGYEGDGTLNNPIVFLLEGLEVKSYATLRTSLTFIPDEDGGRLDSRVFLERHSAATPSEDFPINAAGLAMESGADEEYPHLVDLQFFIGDTINTNGVGDAGKIRFQVKSDVTGTILMNEMALFIQL